MDTELRLGVPLDPIAAGLAWVPGKVSHVSGMPSREGVEGGRAEVEVKLDRFSSSMPKEFGQLVAHYRQKGA